MGIYRKKRSKQLLYAEDLNARTCDDPECDHSACTGALYLHGRCHIKSPTWCKYQNSVLQVFCAECNRLIVKIAVASKTKNILS